MNTLLKNDIKIRAMQGKDLPIVLTTETNAYDFPWSETTFKDCLRVGYDCFVLEYQNDILAHAIISIAAGESHILNICVQQQYQNRGLGRLLMNYLLELITRHNTEMVFLEVRPSNFGAIKLYLDMGFDEIGTRRNYYPSKIGREDALIFAKSIQPISAMREIAYV